jgi:molecular chaperone GrpE
MTSDPEESRDDHAAADVAAPAAGIDDLRRQLEEKQDRLLRTLAEMDNMRRRGQRDREEYTRFATESLIRDLIPVLDNFDRALQAARGAPDASRVVEGVELIQRELLKVLERAGVTRYSALGEAFDPTRHEATARVISTEQPANTVVAEVVPGYRLHDRVLRPAQVAVAVAPDEDAA